MARVRKRMARVVVEDGSCGRKNGAWEKVTRAWERSVRAWVRMELAVGKYGTHARERMVHAWGRTVLAVGEKDAIAGEYGACGGREWCAGVPK